VRTLAAISAKSAPWEKSAAKDAAKCGRWVIEEPKDAVMPTFYVLPARTQIGEHFQAYLGTVFPGLSWMRSELSDLAESLAQAAEAQPGVYVVFAEDLAEGIDVEAGLIQSFGAEIGDEVVVVRPNRNMAVVQVERGRIGYQSRAA
jgi:hypothetical protein